MDESEQSYKDMLPSVEELNTAWVDIERIHDEHLAQHEVKLPSSTSYKKIWLAMLHHYCYRPVHKDEISEAVQREYPDAGKDQQVRHLKRDGWNITFPKRGYHQLKDPYRPSQEFYNEQNRRRDRLTYKDFSELKKKFGNLCANCGAREGEPDPRYGSDKVILEKCHKDPNFPSDDLKNIIPQCQFCNREYKSDFVFDDKGQVCAIGSANPVERASEEAKKKVVEYLRSSGYLKDS